MEMMTNDKLERFVACSRDLNTVKFPDNVKKVQLPRIDMAEEGE